MMTLISCWIYSGWSSLQSNSVSDIDISFLTLTHAIYFTRLVFCLKHWHLISDTVYKREAIFNLQLFYVCGIGVLFSYSNVGFRDGNAPLITLSIISFTRPWTMRHKNGFQHLPEVTCTHWPSDLRMTTSSYPQYKKKCFWLRFEFQLTLSAPPN